MGKRPRVTATVIFFYVSLEGIIPKKEMVIYSHSIPHGFFC